MIQVTQRFTLMLAVLLISFCAVAQSNADGTPAAISEEEQMMQAMMKYSLPGDMHQKLAAMVGEWNLKGRSRYGADAPFQNWNATAVITPVLDGRFTHEHVQGEANPSEPMTFEGMQVMGFDIHAQKFNAVWIDNFGTKMNIGSGELGADGKTLFINFESFNPVSNVLEKWRNEYEMLSKDLFKLKTYMIEGTDAEYHQMTITYERK